MTQSVGTTATADNNADSWQRRLLPFMIGLVLVLSLFFFAATMVQLYQLNLKIRQVPELSNTELLDSADSGATLLEKQWRTLVLLESHILQQRYHQANVLLMARVWVRYLGFVTGMMLALIGAVFILGKLREPTTELSLGSGGESQPTPGNIPGPANMKVQLLTQSPGIVLVTLGTLLMLITIWVHHPIEVNDSPVYTSVSTNEPVAQQAQKPVLLELNSAVNKPQPGIDQTSRLLEQARLRHGVPGEEPSQ